MGSGFGHTLPPTRHRAIMMHLSRANGPNLFLVVLCLVAIGSSSLLSADAFAVRTSSSSIMRTALLNVSQGNNNNDDVERLRDSATRLRKEAEELEAKLKDRRPAATAAKTGVDADRVPKVYTDLNDSEWIISYRFASDPPPKDDDDDSGKAAAPLLYYSGKIAVKFKNDGYTEILNTEQVKDIQYTKLWGWDEEISNDDNLKHMLFSADVVLPQSDKNAGTERFYFQARVDQDERTGEISISDGKVTTKRDIEPPGGFWGVFSGKGILAQFRACGDFVCRPR